MNIGTAKVGESVVIYVNQSHIDTGKQGICSRCPIALAINDLYPDGSITVVGRVTSIVCGSINVTLLNSKEILEFISLFDIQGKDAVNPSEFTLTVRNIFDFKTVSQ